MERECLSGTSSRKRKAGFTTAGYFLGVHAPGHKGISNFLQAMHHAALCQAEGARVIRSLNSTLKIGTTFSCSHVEPISMSEADVLAAARIDALLNRTFVEPLLGKGYPVDDLKVLQRVERYIKDGDEAKLALDMDFIPQKRIVKSSGFWYSRFIKHYLSHLNSNLTAKVHRAGFH